MNKTCLTFLLSLSVLIAHAQSEELVYWNSQSTYNYSYPQYGDSLATVVSSAIQTPSGLTPYQFVDSRNIWYNPNPTDGKLSIDLGSDYPMIHTILTDITGKVVQSNTFEGGQLLDLTLEAPIGVYLLNIETNEKKVTIRLIKE